MAILGDYGCGKRNAGKWNDKLLKRRIKMSKNFISGIIINYVLGVVLACLLVNMGFTVLMWQWWAVMGLACAFLANGMLNS
jgi:hypothetical protein